MATRVEPFAWFIQSAMSKVGPIMAGWNKSSVFARHQAANSGNGENRTVGGSDEMKR